MKTQGLSMVSGDGKHFHWVIFKHPSSGRQKRTVSHSLFVCWVNFYFYKLPSSKELSVYLCPSIYVDITCFVWPPLVQNWKLFSTPSEKSTYQCSLCFIEQLFSLPSGCAVLWQNKYLVTLGFYLWTSFTEYQEKRNNSNFVLLDYISCGSENLVFTAW